jgi:hypothetical protein
MKITKPELKSLIKECLVEEGLFKKKINYGKTKSGVPRTKDEFDTDLHSGIGWDYTEEPSGALYDRANRYDEHDDIISKALGIDYKGTFRRYNKDEYVLIADELKRRYPKEYKWQFDDRKEELLDFIDTVSDDLFDKITNSKIFKALAWPLEKISDLIDPPEPWDN